MHTPIEKSATESGPVLRPPVAEDGAGVNDLVAACPPLDRNSLYCNLLQCTHFADTCVLAEQGGEFQGWISAYRLPGDRETLFVWQVAVHENARGSGLARRMLTALLERAACRDVRRIETTVTPENHASRALFRSFARHAEAPISEAPRFDSETHFHGRHESECLIAIGPIRRDSPLRQRAASAA